MSNYTQRPKGKKAKGKKKSFGRKFREAVIPMKGDGALEIIRKLVFVGAVIAFAITGGSLLYDVGTEMYQMYVKTDSYKNDRTNGIDGTIDLPSDVIDEVRNKVPEIQADFIKLYARNNDIVGWVKINDDIDLPVVQSTDNAYYLTHDFDKAESKSGTIFADYRASISAEKTSGNIVMYGHNMWSSTMFSKLTRYYYEKDLEGATDEVKKLSYYKKNPLVQFDTIYGNGTYKIFACCLFNTDYNDGEVYPYTEKINFANKDDFNNYILDVMDRSSFFTDVDLTYGDEIITLSTCYMLYDTDTLRCVIFARKVRDGESTDVDVSKAVINYNRLLFQDEIDRGVGFAWTKRTWDTSYLLSYDGD